MRARTVHYWHRFGRAMTRVRADETGIRLVADTYLSPADARDLARELTAFYRDAVKAGRAS